jgi:putative transposase
VDYPEQKHKHLKHYNTPGHAHELTFSCYHHFTYLSDPVACGLFLFELEQARREYDFSLWAYVLMPTHVHLLIWPHMNRYDIALILNSIKGRMVNSYQKFIEENKPENLNAFQAFDKSKKRSVFRFWQQGGGFDRNLWTGIAINKSIEYIEANPVRRNLATKPSEYLWSSAYAREKNVGLIPDKFNIPVAMLNPQIQRISVM